MLRRMVTRNTFASAFVGFFLLAAAWAFALPFDGPADEFQHVGRAYGVLSGQIGARVDARITVPQSLVPTGVSDTGSCVRWHLDRTAACMGPVNANPGDTTRMVVTGSGAANYNPLYYAVVGLPIKLSPDYHGIVAARLLTGAITSALLAGAVWVAVRLRRTGRSGGFLLAGIIAAATPVVVNMTGAVNPAGVEMAAGIGLWAALIAIVNSGDDSRRVWALFGVSAILLAVLRQFGIGWLAGSVLIAALALDRDRLGRLVRQRVFWGWTVAVGAAVVYGGLWIVLSTQEGIRSSTPNGLPPISAGSLAVKELTRRVPYYTNGLVGLTSYGDVAIPFPLVLLWFAAVGLLLVQAVRRCGRIAALQITGLVAGSFVVLVLSDVQARQGGFWLSQGRYALPALVGAPMLAAYWLGREEAFSEARQRTLIRWFALLLTPVQGVALWLTMIRYQHGFNSRHPWLLDLFQDTPSVNPFSGTWLPPAGPWLPVALCLLGIAVLVVLLWVAAGPAVDQKSETYSAPDGRYAAETPPVLPSPRPRKNARKEDPRPGSKNTVTVTQRTR